MANLVVKKLLTSLHDPDNITANYSLHSGITIFALLYDASKLKKIRYPEVDVHLL